MAVRIVSQDELIEAQDKFTGLKAEVDTMNDALAQRLPAITSLQKAVKELADE